MIFGMAVRDALPSDAIPVEAIAVVKYLDSDGDPCFAVVATERLQDIEALGMLNAAHTAQLSNIMGRFEDAGEE